MKYTLKLMSVFCFYLQISLIIILVKNENNESMNVWNAFLPQKNILMCKSQHFNPIGITCSKLITTYK